MSFGGAPPGKVDQISHLPLTLSSVNLHPLTIHQVRHSITKQRLDPTCDDFAFGYRSKYLLRRNGASYAGQKAEPGCTAPETKQASSTQGRGSRRLASMFFSPSQPTSAKAGSSLKAMIHSRTSASQSQRSARMRSSMKSAFSPPAPTAVHMPATQPTPRSVAPPSAHPDAFVPMQTTLKLPALKHRIPSDAEIIDLTREEEEEEVEELLGSTESAEAVRRHLTTPASIKRRPRSEEDGILVSSSDETDCSDEEPDCCNGSSCRQCGGSSIAEMDPVPQDGMTSDEGCNMAENEEEHDEEPSPGKAAVVDVEEKEVTIKEEPISIKEEPFIIKEEPFSIKEEPFPIKEEPFPIKEEPIILKEEPSLSSGLSIPPHLLLDDYKDEGESSVEVIMVHRKQSPRRKGKDGPGDSRDCPIDIDSDSDDPPVASVPPPPSQSPDGPPQQPIGGVDRDPEDRREAAASVPPTKRVKFDVSNLTEEAADREPPAFNLSQLLDDIANEDLEDGSVDTGGNRLLSQPIDQDEDEDEDMADDVEDKENRPLSQLIDEIEDEAGTMPLCSIDDAMEGAKTIGSTEDREAAASPSPEINELRDLASSPPSSSTTPPLPLSPPPSRGSAERSLAATAPEAKLTPARAGQPSLVRASCSGQGEQGSSAHRCAAAQQLAEVRDALWSTVSQHSDLFVRPFSDKSPRVRQQKAEKYLRMRGELVSLLRTLRRADDASHPRCRDKVDKATVFLQAHLETVFSAYNWPHSVAADDDVAELHERFCVDGYAWIVIVFENTARCFADWLTELDAHERQDASAIERIRAQQLTPPSSVTKPTSSSSSQSSL